MIRFSEEALRRHQPREERAQLGRFILEPTGNNSFFVVDKESTHPYRRFLCSADKANAELIINALNTCEALK